MKKGARKKVRLWGPASGGVERWRGAAVIPARHANALLLNLHAWRKAGSIGAYHFERRGFLGSGGAAFWVGRVRKADRAACGARTRQGTPCKARCVAGRGRCRLRGLTIFGTKTYAKARSGISRDSHKLIPSVQREDLIYEI